MKINDKKIIRKIFANNLKKYRQKLGLSQESLADLAGIHRTYISSLECGNRNVSIDNIEKLAIALKIHAANLLEE